MPRLNPDALTFVTFTSSYPPVELVIRSAQGIEAMGFDHVWSGDRGAADAKSPAVFAAPAARPPP